MNRDRIKFRRWFKGNSYDVVIEKPRDMFVSEFLADYIFYYSLGSNYHMTMFIRDNGRPSGLDKKRLADIEIISVTQVSPVQTQEFKVGKIQ